MPILSPLGGNSLDGIKNIFTGFLLITQIQKKKSMGLSFPRLKIQWPASFLTDLPLFIFLWTMLQDFTSTIFPPQSMSAPPLLNCRCLAPRNFDTYCSHLKPNPVSDSQNFLSFLKKQRDLVFFTYHARFMHIPEQYLGLWVGLPQNKHLFIS